VKSRITLQDVVSFDIQDTHSLDQSATRGQIFKPPGVKSLFLTPKSSGDREAKKKKKGKKEKRGRVCHESKKVLLVTVGKMEEGPPAMTSRGSCQNAVSCVD